MIRILNNRFVYMTAGTLMLAACGGGGGSTPAPTTPTTPTPTNNDSLVGVLVDEDFNSFSSVVVVNDTSNTAETHNASETNEAITGIHKDGSFDITITNFGADNDINLSEIFTNEMLRIPADNSDNPRSLTNNKSTFADATTNATISLSVFVPGKDVYVPNHPDNKTVNLSYVSYGQWAKSDGTIAANGFDVARGYLTFGVRTDTVPTSGEASYIGVVEGVTYDPAASGQKFSFIQGRVDIDVNFASGSVNSEFRDMQKFVSNVPSAWVDFDTSGTINDGLFSGAITNPTVAGYSGTVAGAFYGPDAAEIGGTWAVSGPAGEKASGAFVGEKQP